MAPIFRLHDHISYHLLVCQQMWEQSSDDAIGATDNPRLHVHPSEEQGDLSCGCNTGALCVGLGYFRVSCRVSQAWLFRSRTDRLFSLVPTLFSALTGDIFTTSPLGLVFSFGSFSSHLCLRPAGFDLMMSLVCPSTLTLSVARLVTYCLHALLTWSTRNSWQASVCPRTRRDPPQT